MFASGATVRHLSATLAPGANQADIALADAAPANRSFAVLSSSAVGAKQTQDGEWAVRGELVSPTALRVRRAQTTTTAEVAAQVVTFDADSGASVQTGTAVLSGGSAAVSFAPVAGQSPFVLFSNSAPAGGVEGTYRVRGSVSAAQATFATASSASPWVTYYLVFVPGATVQGGTAGFAAEASEGSSAADPQPGVHTATVTPAAAVDAGRSFALVTTSGGAGRADALGDTLFTATLTAGGVHLERADRVDGGAGVSPLEAAAQAAWQTVQLPAAPQVVVSVLSLSDAVEGGAAGAFRFVRQGDLSQPLTVTYTVGGTATPGADYAALSGTVTFPTVPSTGPAVDFVDVPVSALTGDPARVGGRVSVALQRGTGYAIPDDSATAPAGFGAPVGSANADVRIIDNTQLVFTLPADPSALDQPPLAGAISYTFPWNQVDPALDTQTIALPDFDLSIAGRDFRYAPGTDPTYAFAGVPTATFQGGVFVGVTFSITSAAGAPPLAGVYTSLSSGAAGAATPGLTVTATNALGNAASVRLVPVSPAYFVDEFVKAGQPKQPKQDFTIDNVKDDLKKDPTAQALLKAFEDAKGVVKAGDAPTGAQLQGEQLIVLDPKKLASRADGVSGLLFELLRWEFREDQEKIFKKLADISNNPKNPDQVVEQAILEAVSVSEKLTYKVMQKHHKIAEAAVSRKENPWDGGTDTYAPAAKVTEADFLKYMKDDPNSGDGKTSHTNRLIQHLRKQIGLTK